MSQRTVDASIDVKASVRFEALVMSLWIIAAPITLIYIYKDSHIVFLVSQIIYKLLQIHKCLLVGVNIAYACRLVFILYVLLLLSYSSVIWVCLVSNPVHCNICYYLASFPSVSDVAPPSTTGGITPRVNHTVCPSAQSSAPPPGLYLPSKLALEVLNSTHASPKVFLSVW
jgi:hypothetical protein